MEPLAREVWGLISQLWLAERPRINDELAALGLHPMQALALRHLEQDRPEPMRALADTLRCDASNITGIADRLEAAGYVERRPSPEDRRVKTLVLTDSGARARAKLAEIWTTPPPPIAALAEDDLETVRDILQRALAASPRA